MIKPQILEAIKQMPKVEKIEMIEFALRLVREDMEMHHGPSLQALSYWPRPKFSLVDNLLDRIWSS